MRTTRTIHIVLASPGDVEEERREFVDVVDRVRQLVLSTGLTLELRKWEDGPPRYGPDGVQALIEDELEIEKCDVLVGIFYKRFGAVDKDGKSRTEHEIRKALALRESGRPRPETMLYFCGRPSTPESAEELEEHALVLRFKKKLQDGKVKTKDYGEVNDWKLIVLTDLVKVIWDMAHLTILPSPFPNANAWALPAEIRSIGFTEQVADINLEITEVSKEEILTINLLADTSFTNRLVDETLTDIALITKDRTKVLARGRLIARNAVQFDSVVLTPAERHEFIITGVRLSAAFLGLASTFNRKYVQIDVALAYGRGTDVLHKVTVGWIEMPYQFEMSRNEPFRIEGAYVFLARVRELFPNALKTKEQERGDNGTVLLLQFSSLPPGYEVFISTRSIPQGSVAGGLEAVGVNVNPNGVPVSQTAAVGSLEQLGGISISRLPESGVAAWEVVRSPGYALGELVFGVIVRGPSAKPQLLFLVAATLAPFYTGPRGRANSALPVPRFLPGLTPRNVPLG